jgi:hypothetical protein
MISGLGRWVAGGGCGGLAENFEHDRAAGGTLAFDGLASVFHRFLKAIRNFFLGLAFDTISFSHKNFAVRASCPNGKGSILIRGQNVKPE